MNEMGKVVDKKDALSKVSENVTEAIVKASKSAVNEFFKQMVKELEAGSFEKGQSGKISVMNPEGSSKKNVMKVSSDKVRNCNLESSFKKKGV